MDDVLGADVPIRGFRAPTFSLDHRTRWALPLLAEHGYDYDSSVFPMKSPLYGVPGAPLDLYTVDPDDPAREAPDAPLVEVPQAVCRLLGVRLPVGGGVYMRVLPFRLLTALLRRVNARRPFVIYLHPWETDAQGPRIDLPVVSRFFTYHGVDRTLGKLDRLLQLFSFTTVANVVDRWRRQREDDGRC